MTEEFVQVYTACDCAKNREYGPSRPWRDGRQTRASFIHDALASVACTTHPSLAHIIWPSDSSAALLTPSGAGTPRYSRSRAMHAAKTGKLISGTPPT
jgi:hypothetical protein